MFRARPHPLDASFVHVIYSRLYEHDCGLTSHPGDNEAFSLTIDPTHAAPERIVAVRAISHQSTICDRDTICGACPGLSPCDTADLGGRAFPVVYASKDKHASVVDVDVGVGCSLFGSCLDRCELAVTTTIVLLVNGGEPEHPLNDDLSDPTQGGFITAANGWTRGAASRSAPQASCATTSWTTRSTRRPVADLAPPLDTSTPRPSVAVTTTILALVNGGEAHADLARERPFVTQWTLTR